MIPTSGQTEFVTLYREEPVEKERKLDGAPSKSGRGPARLELRRSKCGALGSLVRVTIARAAVLLAEPMAVTHGDLDLNRCEIVIFKSAWQEQVTTPKTGKVDASPCSLPWLRSWEILARP